MYDRKRQKGYILRSIRRALSYIEETKRQSINSTYNRYMDYKQRTKDEIKYAIDFLNTYFK